MSFTKDSFGFRDDYFYYQASYIGGRFDSPELHSFKGVYRVTDMSHLSLGTNTYGTILSVCVYGRYSMDDVSVRSFYLDDYKENRAFYDTLVHNVNTRIKYYKNGIEGRDSCFVCKMFALLLVLFIVFVVYMCGIS